MEVILHVYDVTTSGSNRANSAVLHINRIFKDRFRLGGIFHSAVQVLPFFLSIFVSSSLWHVFHCDFLNRYMEKRNGRLGSVN